MLCVLCASVFQILSLPVSVPIHNSMETIHEPLFMRIDQQSEPALRLLKSRRQRESAEVAGTTGDSRGRFALWRIGDDVGRQRSRASGIAVPKPELGNEKEG